MLSAPCFDGVSTMSVLWPNQRSFALALSHDVDRVAKRWQYFYYTTLAVLNGQANRVWRHVQSFGALLQGDDPYWNFGRIMALEEELDVRSTFFLLNEQGQASLFRPRSMVLFLGRYSMEEKRVRRIIRELHAGGWEVGLHGSYNSFRDEALLRREKSELETILGEPVMGIRQHYLNLDIPETWQIQASVGFAYDSSLGFSDRLGLRWGASRPFYPRVTLTGSEIPILEIPQAMMDSHLIGVEDAWSRVQALIDTVERQQGVLTINWHQRVFNPWEYQEHQDMYCRIVRECRKRGAWVASLGAIASWWRREIGGA